MNQHLKPKQGLIHSFNLETNLAQFLATINFSSLIVEKSDRSKSSIAIADYWQIVEPNLA
ncbi:MAG: hypothetical protein AB4372_00405 [Xenococcus sp. (in: cyanobacteria)]